MIGRTIGKTLGEIMAQDVTFKSEKAQAAIAQGRYLRSRGEDVGVAAVFIKAVEIDGLGALERLRQEAVSKLHQLFGTEKAECAVNALRVNLLKAVKGHIDLPTAVHNVEEALA